MGNDYIDKFGGDRKYVSPEDSKRIYVPIAMGAICVVIYAVYLWSAFNSRSAVMALLFFVPILSIIGMVFSFITRSIRDTRFKLWFLGLISCALSFVLFILLYFASWVVLAQR